VGGQPRVLGLVSTGDAAVRVAAHRGWLREAMADNDRFLFDRAPSGRGPAATAEDAPAWFGAPRADRAGGAAGDRLTGGEDDDVLFGRGGGDLLEGLGGDDLLAGGAGPDTLSGGPGRDTLIGGDGRDRLLGGPGFDTAVYPGESGDYAVEAAGRGHRIVFAGGAAERLVEIERVLFADGGFILDA
jgi:Ca2+-binding RTX toxin-like protein